MSDYTPQINQIYRTVLGRDGDPEGLAYYNNMFNRLSADGGLNSENINSVVDQFSSSAEAKQLGRSAPAGFAAQLVSEMGAPRSNSDVTWLSSLQGPTATTLQDRFAAGEGRAGVWDAAAGKWIDPFEGNYISDPRMQNQFGTPYFLPNADRLGTPQNGSILGGFVGANNPANWYSAFGIDSGRPNFSSNVSDFTSQTGEFTRSGGLFDPTLGKQNPDGTFTYFSNTVPEQVTSQWHDNEDDGFGDLLPMIALAALAIYTGGFGLYGASAELGAAGTGFIDAIGTGVGAGAEISGALGTTAAAAAETAAMSQWAAVPAESLGNTVLTNAAIGAGTSAATGRDPITGALTGALGGLISSTGIMSDVAGSLIPEGASSAAASAITKGVNAATTGAISAVAQGGSFSDILTAGATSGLTSAAGNYVGGELRADGTSGTLSGAAGGATAGLTNAILTGGDIATGLMAGAAGGAAGGAASDAGIGSATSGAIGTVVGGLVGSAVQPDPVTTTAVTPTPTPAPVTTTETGAGLSWTNVLPDYIHNPRADMQWGTRLTGA